MGPTLLFYVRQRLIPLPPGHLVLPVVLRKEKLVEPVRRLPGEVVCQLSVLRQIDALLMDQGG